MINQSSEISLTLQQRVYRIVEGVLTDPTLFIVDVEVRGNKGSRVVDIFIDSDGALDVNTLADLSREIGFMLDSEDVVDGRYQLNVSSPGLDRPLKTNRQLKKNIGRQLKVTRESEDKHAVLKGKLLEVTEESIQLAVTKKRVEDIPLKEVVEAKVILPW